MASLSDAQQEAIKIVPRVTAALSVVGSASILFSELRRRNSDGNVVGRKLLIGMSVLDLLSSASYVIGNVMFPLEAGGRGNQATCNGESDTVRVVRSALLLLHLFR